jgi:hypothetical protein
MRNLARLRWWILGALIAVALASSLAAILLGTRWQDVVLNFGTEMAGAVVTYGLFELVIERRERREAEKKEIEAKKAELIIQMGSRVNSIAVEAVEELRRRDWLTDGSVRGADLEDANLRGVDLSRANLRGADLRDAELQEADLGGANLKEADLSYANLEGARLWPARLAGAWLVEANLEGAWLRPRELAEATKLNSATLPDGTKLSEDNWEAEFEEWREKQEEQDEDDEWNDDD